MKFKFFIVCSLIGVGYANAASSTVLADHAYTSKNLKALSSIYSNNSDNETIFYLYAELALKNNDPTPARKFILNSSDTYMRTNLIHLILDYYYQNRDFGNYVKFYHNFPKDQANLNEKCGLDLSNLALGNNEAMLTNSTWLVSNNTSNWCGDLIASLFHDNELAATDKDTMLYNLILDGNTTRVNQIRKALGEETINFNSYDSENPFQLVNRLVKIGKNDPASAYSKANSLDLDTNTQRFIYNYLAMRFATKQNFSQALKLYQGYPTNMLSDDEYEWLTRTYMYFGNWDAVLHSIEKMPLALKQKNVWLFWKGYAYKKLGNKTQANANFEQIPRDGSYYSLLAQSELGRKIAVIQPSTHAKAVKDPSHYANEARLALNLYNLAKANNDSHLMGVAVARWNYAAKKAPENALLMMTNLAYSSGLYDMAIYAATLLNDSHMGLAFPKPFYANYKQHSSDNGISPAYALAVTHQESRFKYSVVAFDGGLGLMQIMPATATEIARKSGSSRCNLLTSNCNIKFGTWYLGNLYSKFGSLIYSTAGYNAGPGRAKVWQANLGSLDPKIQIELIPFDITRNYVQRVVRNKAIYDSEFAGVRFVNLSNYVEHLK